MSNVFMLNPSFLFPKIRTLPSDIMMFDQSNGKRQFDFVKLQKYLDYLYSLNAWTVQKHVVFSNIQVCVYSPFGLLHVKAIEFLCLSIEVWTLLHWDHFSKLNDLPLGFFTLVFIYICSGHSMIIIILCSECVKWRWLAIDWFFFSVS